MTATSANGLALMWEVLYIAASLRTPIVMSLVSRALSAPADIHCDHADMMGMRDSGWIMLLCENPQEAYDNTIQAVRIAEHPDVLLPVAVCQDGFITSHGVERVEVCDDAVVQEMIGSYTPQWPLLDLEHPKTYGPVSFHETYYEHKRQQVQAMEDAQRVILSVAQQFGEALGRHYGLFETYRLQDASIGIAQGYKTYFLQDADGQMKETHSVAAGLDYVGVSPILAHLKETGRVRFEAATDREVVDVLALTIRREGLIPALESAHAFVQAFKEAPTLSREDILIINQSGRGDKDIFTIADAFGDPKWQEFIIQKAEKYHA